MDSSAPHRRAGVARLLEPEMLVALSAVILGVCALVVSVIQVRMMHEQQHASAWPRLVVMPSRGETGFTIDVTNPGMGPALIQYVKTSVDGRPAERWPAALAALVPQDPPDDLMYFSTIRDRVIPPGESVRALELRNQEEIASVLREIDRLDMEICYCSVYNRCWTVAGPFTRRAVPVAVRACPAPDATMFAD